MMDLETGDRTSHPAPSEIKSPKAIRRNPLARSAPSSGGVASSVPNANSILAKGTAPVLQAKNQRKSPIDAVKSGDYTAPTGLSRNQRAAHFIVWCGINYPDEMLEWRWIYAAINGYVKAPTRESRDVQLLQQGSSAISKITLEKYQVPTHNVPGFIRAAYNDGDAADTALRRKVQRYESAQKSMESVAKVIDPSKIKDKALATWAAKVRGLLSSVEATTKKLLPPAPKKDE